MQYKSFQSIIKCHGDERRSLLASQEAVWEPLTASSVSASAGPRLSKLQIGLANRDALMRIGWQQPVGLYPAQNWRTALWPLPPTQRTSMQGFQGVLGCGSLKLQQHTNTTPSIQPYGCRVVLSPCLAIPVRLKLFFIGKWWKMTPQKQSKTPVFIFKKVLQAAKMVAHQNRPVTDSCSAFECLGLQNASVRLTMT